MFVIGKHEPQPKYLELVITIILATIAKKFTNSYRSPRVDICIVSQNLIRAYIRSST